jgi:hypothetical protein
MKRTLAATVVILLTATALAREDKPLVDPAKQKQIADSLHSLLQPTSRVFLYSVNPAPYKESARSRTEMFHGYQVLGRVEITDTKEKQALLDALCEGVRNNDGMVIFCFNPRHALRIENTGSRVDLTICFECQQIVPHGFNHDRGIVLSREAEVVFDRSVRKHGLPKPKA